MKASTLLLPLVVGGFVSLTSAPAHADCTCEQEDPSVSLNASDIVFWGKASVDKEGDVVFRVSKSYKGTRRKRKHTVVPAKECGFQFEEGTAYVVFAKKDDKRTIVVQTCSATRPLPEAPYTATTWSAADELPYGAGRRTVRSHQRDRDRLTKRALDKVKYAAKKCDPAWKKGKEEVNLLLSVRFDVQPDGKYDAEIITHEVSDKAEADMKNCLSKRLDGKKFRKFSGNAVSVRAYWKINRIDASMQQEKTSSVVKPYEGDGSETKEVAKGEKSKKKGG
jgi:hypothetical protein